VIREFAISPGIDQLEAPGPPACPALLSVPADFASDKATQAA
jgi:hypothetical protein